MQLRTRFFLISWPIVVLAIVAVAFGVDRWTVVELERIEETRTGVRPARDTAREARWADSISSLWTRRDSAPSASQLAAISAGATPQPGLAVIDSGGRLVSSSAASLRLVAPPAAVGGIARFTVRTPMVRDGEGEVEFALSGRVLRRDARTLGALYVLPLPRAMGETVSPAARARALRRRIWYIALAASLAAAVASLLLAGPLVRRVARLGAAASAVRGGALDTRIADDARDELGELAGSFNAMAESLGQSRDNQRKLIGDVAHELRTPLTNVVGLVEAMQDGLRPADAATLGTLRAEVGLLTSLVHELQELSLAEAGQLRLVIGDVDASGIVRDAVAAHDASADGRVVRARGVERPVFVRADPQRLAQALRNLLDNARTHTPEGGSITVHLDRNAGTVSIAVEDDGAGIPAEHLPLVFERFHRVDPSRARSTGGMGLGLALVRELASAMGGRVFVTSEPGQGSRFTLELISASIDRPS